MGNNCQVFMRPKPTDSTPSNVFQPLLGFEKKLQIHEKELFKSLQINEQIKNIQIRPERAKPDLIRVKYPTNDTFTRFSWVQKENTIILPDIRDLPYQEIKKKSFFEKLQWFSYHVRTLKNQQKAKKCQIIKINKDKIVNSTKEALKNKNLLEQWIIHFGEESQIECEISQWINQYLEYVFNEKTEIFSACITEENVYKFVQTKKGNQEKQQRISMLGTLIGKAILQQKTIKCHFNRVIFRHIAHQQVKLCDVFSFDENIYNLSQSILEIESAQSLGLYYHKKSGGDNIDNSMKKIKVTNKNRQEFINQNLEKQCIQPFKKFLEKLLSSLYSVIPAKLFSIFEPYQLQMVICGYPEINVKEWMQNTNYDGFTPNHERIQQFWSLIENCSEKKKEKILEFCTGFKRLVQKGKTKKFKIKKISYNVLNPNIRSSPKENTLLLPDFSSFQELKKQFDNVFGFK